MNPINIKNSYVMGVTFFLSLVSLESFKDFLNDNHGGLVLPNSGKAYNDEDFLEYQRLEVDKTIKSVLPEDLPSDFCGEACRLVDEFRRKTVNEKVEWMLYFDYKTGDIIYCWKGNEGKCGGDYERINFHGRNMASVHSHQKGYYSFPSPENFDILQNEFEDYEIITSINAMWIIEFKGKVDSQVRREFQKDFSIEFNKFEYNIKLMYNDINAVRTVVEKLFSDYLVNELDKNLDNILLNLIKREYD